MAKHVETAAMGPRAAERADASLLRRLRSPTEPLPPKGGEDPDTTPDEDRQS